MNEQKEEMHIVKEVRMPSHPYIHRAVKDALIFVGLAKDTEGRSILVKKGTFIVRPVLTIDVEDDGIINISIELGNLDEGDYIELKGDEFE